MPTFLNTVFSHPWAVWIIVAVICALLEIALPSFSFIFATIAALGASLLSLGAGWPFQFGAFSFILFLTLFLLRPRLLEKLHTHEKFPSRSEVLIGKPGRVTEAINPTTGAGRVSVEGQDWAARSDRAIAYGQTVQVQGVDGIVLNVISSPEA